MNKECGLCNGEYDFRSVSVSGLLKVKVISFPGNRLDVNNENRFRYCPLCGKELTIENFNNRKEPFMKGDLFDE